MYFLKRLTVWTLRRRSWRQRSSWAVPRPGTSPPRGCSRGSSRATGRPARNSSPNSGRKSLRSRARLMSSRSELATHNLLQWTAWIMILGPNSITWLISIVFQMNKVFGVHFNILIICNAKWVKPKHILNEIFSRSLNQKLTLEHSKLKAEFDKLRDNENAKTAKLHDLMWVPTVIKTYISFLSRGRTKIINSSKFLIELKGKDFLKDSIFIENNSGNFPLVGSSEKKNFVSSQFWAPLPN